MAKLTPTLTLSSNDISTSEQLNLTLTGDLDVGGPVETKRMSIASTATDLSVQNVVLAAANYTKSFVLLYNTVTHGTANQIITLGTAVASGTPNDEDLLATSTQISLAPAEWAFFPWESDVDLCANASTGSPILEVRVFQNVGS